MIESYTNNFVLTLYNLNLYYFLLASIYKYIFGFKRFLAYVNHTFGFRRFRRRREVEARCLALSRHLQENGI